MERLLDANPDLPEFSELEKPFLGIPFTTKEIVQIKGVLELLLKF